MDNEDFEKVSAFKWHVYRAHNNRGLWYARRQVRTPKGQRGLHLHSFLFPVKAGMEIDHRNGNGLDCRKKNLRAATRLQNAKNRSKAVGTLSRFKGVSFHKQRQKWCAYIQNSWIGLFSTEINAARAYNQEARKRFKSFARLNVIT